MAEEETTVDGVPTRDVAEAWTKHAADMAATLDRADEIATLRQEMAELRTERDILNQQLGDSRALCYGHVDQRDLDAARAEVERLRDAIKHIVALVDHDTSLPVLLHAVVELRKFVHPLEGGT